MAYVVRKVINGKPYLYLIESKRVGGKVKKKTIAYLGTNPTIAEIREKLADLTRSESEIVIKKLKSIVGGRK